MESLIKILLSIQLLVDLDVLLMKYLFNLFNIQYVMYPKINFIISIALYIYCIVV